MGIVFIVLFVLVTVIGFFAARWRRGDLNLLNEWGLGGRRFGSLVTWFLLGGDLYVVSVWSAVAAAVRRRAPESGISERDYQPAAALDWAAAQGDY